MQTSPHGDAVLSARPTITLAPVGSIRRLKPTGPVLAAMASVPDWLASHVAGRPVGTFAVGPVVKLLWVALAERKASADRSERAMSAYRAALDGQFAASVAAGDFAPGTLAYSADGQIRPVPDGAVFVCTCSAGVTCHLDWLGPHLARAGWRVVGREGEVVDE